MFNTIIVTHTADIKNKVNPIEFDKKESRISLISTECDKLVMERFVTFLTP